MVFGYWVWLFWAVPVPISGFVFAFRPACRPAFAGADVGRKGLFDDGHIEASRTAGYKTV